MDDRKLLIGTRGSPLALWQANHVRALLIAAHGLGEDAVALEPITTSGDRIRDKPLRDFGGKGLFTKEIDEALLAKTVDIAVHSMKDLPTELPPGITIAAVLPRGDVRDAFISAKGESLAALPPGAVVGSSSLRRQAQVKRLRPDLQAIDFRGNVETRLKKLDQGMVDATLLALAGLERLGLTRHVTSVLPTDEMLPAVAQGAIGVACRSDDAQTRDLLQALNDDAHRHRRRLRARASLESSTGRAGRRSRASPRSLTGSCAFAVSCSIPKEPNGMRSRRAAPLKMP